MENVIAAAQAIYTDEQRMLLENFRKMPTEFAPLAEKYEDLGHPPDADTLKSLFAKVEEFGLISGLIPEEEAVPGSTG
ncbi:acyl-CoA dehydrogenase family protein [Pseudosulfitobacter pseudonitzschiae]|uniref:acyl-CoA dehydrogenase family protein n=1 Tax=Pseudosulfitobacter pseudonitzschiae TaxID=1402135 RepID=UPI001CD2CC2B|nr:acyl-CoA dehydrogenase family protein [Pseudosulfitobacter pseudonitzschiae]